MKKKNAVGRGASNVAMKDPKDFKRVKSDKTVLCKFSFKNGLKEAAATLSIVTLVMQTAMISVFLTEIPQASADNEIRAGDIIINEIMKNPAGDDRFQAEWFELFNKTNDNIDLQGCVIHKDYTKYAIDFTINKSAVISAKNYAVITNNNSSSLTEPPVIFTYNRSEFSLKNTGDEIYLSCNNIIIDKIEYDEATFPNQEGFSMSLADPALNNNIGTNWCDSNTAYGSENNNGTPGIENEGCTVKSTVTACVYNDVGNNGSIGEEDYPMEGWEIELSGDKAESKITNEDGCATFGIFIGSYIIDEKDREGWIKTSNSASFTIFEADERPTEKKINFLNYEQIEIGESECGNGDMESGETCDDANLIDGDGCSSSCEMEDGVPADPVCGNGITESNEQCDDSNLSDGDGCSAVCQTEIDDNQDDEEEEVPDESAYSTIWGYKYRDTNKNYSIDENDVKLGGWNLTLEKLEDKAWISQGSALTSSAVENLGYYNFTDLLGGRYRLFESFVGKEGWSATYPNASGYYEFDVVASTTYANIDFANYEEMCGNGIMDENESCDGTDGISAHYRCTSECSLEYIPYCGDNIKNPNEVCDDGNNINGDGCSFSCAIESSKSQSSSPRPSSGGGGSFILPELKISTESVKTINIMEDSVTITWLTSHFASSQVIYAEDGESHDLNMKDDEGNPPKYGYPQTTPEYDREVKITSHSVTITGLDPNTTYYFRTVSRGSFAISMENQFTTSSISEMPKESTKASSDFAENAIVPEDCIYLVEYITPGSLNNAEEVKKLESFLNTYENANLPVNGIYEYADIESVKNFQKKYSNDVLLPWGTVFATGNVFITTKNMINEIYCKKDMPLTAMQLDEITLTKSKLPRAIILIPNPSENANNSDNSILASKPENKPIGNDLVAQDDAGEVKGAATSEEEIQTDLNSENAGLIASNSNINSENGNFPDGIGSVKKNSMIILFVFLFASAAYFMITKRNRSTSE